jgi:hypothetical protein
MTAPARVTDDDGDPLEGLDWSCEWKTEAASRMFRQVKAFCGLPPAIPDPLTDDMVQQALADARAILDGLDDHIVAEEEAIEDGIEDFDEPGASDPSNFRRLCAEADARARPQPVPEDILRARRLLDGDWSLERTWRETNHQAAIEGRAAWSTVEALMLGLRERGTAGLDEPAIQHRLAQLNDEQIIELGTRLRRLKAEIAPAWTADQVELLIQARERLK